MKPVALRNVTEWRKLHASAKALILLPVSKDKPNASFLLLAAEPAPAGKYRLLGTIP